MRAARWGRIINLSSVAAQYGGVIGPHYAAAKAGILGLTRSYAFQFAKEGITANAIAPALIETDMIAGLPKEVANRSPDWHLRLPRRNRPRRRHPSRKLLHHWPNYQH